MLRQGNLGSDVLDFGAGNRADSSGTTATVAGTSVPATRPAQTVLTFSRVCCSDAVYNEPPTAATTLASAAPAMVPATPMVEPRAAAVIAASAPPTT